VQLRSSLLLAQRRSDTELQEEITMLTKHRGFGYSAVVAAALTLANCSEGTAESASSPQVAAAEHRFSVYFDVGKSGLTPEAQQVIAQALAETNGEASLKLSAAADRSHSKLSERRAEAVRAALVAGGIAPDRIAEVRTADGPPTPGIRDPRDRAVEISIQ
jgi:outer membrane protein OmpA-like peptidoglycan-associated protein